MASEKKGREALIVLKAIYSKIAQKRLKGKAFNKKIDASFRKQGFILTHSRTYDHGHPKYWLPSLFLQWIVHFMFIVNAKGIFLANAI